MSFTIHALRQYKLHKQNKIKVDKSTTMYDEKKSVKIMWASAVSGLVVKI